MNRQGDLRNPSIHLKACPKDRKLHQRSRTTLSQTNILWSGAAHPQITSVKRGARVRREAKRKAEPADDRAEIYTPSELFQYLEITRIWFSKGSLKTSPSTPPQAPSLCISHQSSVPVVNHSLWKQQANAIPSDLKKKGGGLKNET